MPKLKTIYWLPLKRLAEFTCVSKSVTTEDLHKKLKSIAQTIVVLTKDRFFQRNIEKQNILFVSPASTNSIKSVLPRLRQLQSKIYIAPDDEDVKEIKKLTKDLKNVTVLYSNVDNFIGDHVVRLIDTLICEDIRVKLDCIKTQEIDSWKQYVSMHLENFRKYGKVVANKYNAKPTDGSLSVRVKNGFLITASKTDKANVRKQDLVLVSEVNYNKNSVRYYGKRLPSSETLLHSLVYDTFKNVGAIIHPHWKLATNNKDLEYVRTPQFIPYGTRELAVAVIRLLNKHDFVVMRHHGEIVVGKDLADTIKKLNKIRMQLV